MSPFLLLLAACHDPTPEVAVDDDACVEADDCTEVTDFTMASATVGAAGGEVVLADGSVTLSVPEGALSEDTTITMFRVEDDDPGTTLPAVLVFEPEGLAFATPATLTIAVVDTDFADVDGEPKGMAFLHASDESEVEGLDVEVGIAASDEGENTGLASPTKSYLSTSINHFSFVHLVYVKLDPMWAATFTAATSVPSALVGGSATRTITGSFATATPGTDLPVTLTGSLVTPERGRTVDATFHATLSSTSAASSTVPSLTWATADAPYTCGQVWTAGMVVRLGHFLA